MHRRGLLLVLRVDVDGCFRQFGAVLVTQVDFFGRDLKLPRVVL
jgi:hypothetical protein